MKRFWRLIVLGGITYLAYLVLYRPPYAQAHLASIVKIAAAAAVFALLLKLLEMSAKAFKLTLEIIFVVGVMTYLGFSLPPSTGLPPIKAWWNEHCPTREAAAASLRRRGFDPRSAPARWVLSYLPER
jgi:hypothetical protein